MGKRRILVGYGIDVDAVSTHINTTIGGEADLASVSRGFFGATRGVERLLELFKKKNITCSWFIPGHTLETFPEDMAKISAAGHEIGLHGYTHEYPADLSREQFEAVLVKSIDVLTKFCGAKPRGFVAPAWRNHPNQIELLEQYGIGYDHSYMHDDFQPYYLSKGDDEYVVTDYKNPPETWMVPLKHSEKSKLVEIPANWTLDDWPPFQWSLTQANSHGYVDPWSVERQWKEQFQYCYEHYDTFIFTMSIHPQVSGRPHILNMHERIIDWINNEHDGVEWRTFAEMAQEFREGRI